MSGIILRGQATKIVNKGGGRKCKTEKLGNHMMRMSFGPKEKGTDYIVFECPGCGARNKQSAYRCKGRAGNSLSFKCNKCYREIEVAAPVDLKVDLGNTSGYQYVGLVGPDGKPLK